MLYFIVNELSGKGAGKIAAERIRERLGNTEYVMARTEYHAHAIELARDFSSKADCTGVVAVGGDGTFSEVLNGLDLRMPMGVISAGSGNDFMRTFFPGSNIDSQLDTVLKGETKKIDFLEINGKRSLNVAGTGFDVDILLREKKFHKFLRGSLSYFAALITTLFTMKFRTFDITIDESTRIKQECLLLTAANGRYFGGGLPVSLESSIDDGTIDLVLIKRMPRIKVPGMLIKFLKGKIGEVTKYVDIYHCTQIECSVLPKVDIQLDGELFDIPHFVCRLKEKALNIFVPTNSVAKISD